MKKLSLFMLMAVGLLISGNLKADNVAQIGDTKYPTLAAAIEEVEETQTIKLIADINLGTNPVTINKKVVLDLNGKTIEGSKEGKEAGVLEVSATNGDLTIKATNGGEIKTSAKKANAIVNKGILTIYEGSFTGSYETIWQDAGSCTIEGGSFYSTYDNTVWLEGGSLIIKGGEFYGAWCVLQNDANTNMEINGGHFQPNEGDYGFEYVIYASGTVNINGGTFENAPEKIIEGKATIMGGQFASREIGTTLPKGHFMSSEPNEDGYYEIIEANFEVDNKGYTTFADAISNVSKGGTIALLNDIDEPLAITKDVTLDLRTKAYNNGMAYNITGDIKVENSACLSIIGDGEIGNVNCESGKVEIKFHGRMNGNFYGTNFIIYSGTFAQDPTSYLAERCVVVDGTTYTVVKYVIRVEVGQESIEYFSDLKSAFDYVQNLEGDNYVIDILEDFEFIVDNGKYITLNKGKNITLNLNGHHVHGIMDAHETNKSHAEMIYVTNGHFTIEDLSGEETGIMSFEQINPEPSTWYGNYIINVQSGATFTLKSGTLTNNTKHSTFAIAVSVEIEGGTANIEGGKILGVNSTSCIRPYNRGILNISGGYLSATAYHMIFIQQHTSSSSYKIEINITGGEFEHLGGGNAISCFATNVGQLGNCTVNISGGKFDSRAIGFKLTGEDYHWGGTAWNRDEWNKLYRDLFHATGGQFADNTFYISGTDADGKEFEYEPSLAEILDPDYDLFTQENEDYPYYVGPKEITKSTGDGNWNDLFPDSEKKNIQIEHQVTVVEGYTEAYSLNVKSNGEVIVKTGATLDLTWGLVMEDGASMTIEPGAILKIGVAGIQNTSNSRIVVQTDQTNSAIVTINPEAFLFSDPYISVEYTTSAYKSTDKGYTWYKWQDIGIPTCKAPTFVQLEPATYIMRWNVQTGEYEDVNSITFNEPFRGYIITNDRSESGFTYIMNGRMNAAENQTLKFNVSAESGKESFNFFANSFLTPMDIKTFLQGLSDEDDNIERTVQVFNSKSDTYEPVALSSLKYGSADFTTIAPMQGFYMSTKHNVEASATLNYRNSIWGQTSTEPIHAPQSIESDLNMFNLYAGTGKAKDKLSFFESGIFTAEYENGYDAVKYMNKDFNIFVATERGKQSIVATDLLEGTILTFQAGDAIEYQLSFDRVQCDEYSIVDLMTGSVIEVGEGNTYNFVAEPKSTEERFQIIRKAPWVATSVDEVAEKTNRKGVYTILGQYVGSSADWNKLSTGVYIVDGIKIVK